MNNKYCLPTLSGGLVSNPLGSHSLKKIADLAIVDWNEENFTSLGIQSSFEDAAERNIVGIKFSLSVLCMLRAGYIELHPINFKGKLSNKDKNAGAVCCLLKDELLCVQESVASVGPKLIHLLERTLHGDDYEKRAGIYIVAAAVAANLPIPENLIKKCKFAGYDAYDFMSEEQIFYDLCEARRFSVFRLSHISCRDDA